MSGTGRIALITGAGSGIGRAASLALAARGLSVVLVGRTESTLCETADHVLSAYVGVRTLVVPCDVSKSEEVSRMRDRVVAEMGTPDVLVNNAGVVARASVEDTTDADWSQVLGVNLDGTFFVTRAFLPAMRDRKSTRLNSSHSTLSRMPSSA